MSAPQAAAVSRKELGTAFGSGFMWGAQVSVRGTLVVPKASCTVSRSARPWQGCSRALSMEMSGAGLWARKALRMGSRSSSASDRPEEKARTASASAYWASTGTASLMCSARSPSMTTPSRSSSFQVPLPTSRTMAFPPWRSMAASKLARVRKLGLKNTIARSLSWKIAPGAFCFQAAARARISWAPSGPRSRRWVKAFMPPPARRRGWIR